MVVFGVEEFCFTILPFVRKEAGNAAKEGAATFALENYINFVSQNFSNLMRNGTIGLVKTNSSDTLIIDFVRKNTVIKCKCALIIPLEYHSRMHWMRQGIRRMVRSDTVACSNLEWLFLPHYLNPEVPLQPEPLFLSCLFLSFWLYVCVHAILNQALLAWLRCTFRKVYVHYIRAIICNWNENNIIISVANEKNIIGKLVGDWSRLSSSTVTSF